MSWNSADWKNEDPRPARGGWAPGGYFCICRGPRGCGKRFSGDKRAFRCADCAYKEPDPVPADYSFWLGREGAPA